MATSWKSCGGDKGGVDWWATSWKVNKISPSPDGGRARWGDENTGGNISLHNGFFAPVFDILLLEWRNYGKDYN